MGNGLRDGFSVLKGRVVDRLHGSRQDGHYHLRVEGGAHDHRVAVNVWSRLAPSEVLYLVDEDFRHPVVEAASALPVGLTSVRGEGDPLGLDYVRDHLFDPEAMCPLAYDIPGDDNDLNEKLDHVIGRAMVEADAQVYAFGEPWGPERKRDKVFGFSPGRGIHNIHMNQGSSGRFAAENGVHQDGALLVHFPAARRWMAVFLAFQSQTFCTDDLTGEPLSPDPFR